MKKNNFFILFLIKISLTNTVCHNTGIVPYTYHQGKLLFLLGKGPHGYWSDFSGPSKGSSKKERLDAALTITTRQTHTVFGKFALSHQKTSLLFSKEEEASYAYLKERVKYVLNGTWRNYSLFFVQVDFIPSHMFKEYSTSCGEKIEYAWFDAQKLLKIAQRSHSHHAYYRNKQLRYPFVDMLKLPVASLLFNHLIL